MGCPCPSVSNNMAYIIQTKLRFPFWVEAKQGGMEKTSSVTINGSIIKPYWTEHQQATEKWFTNLFSVLQHLLKYYRELAPMKIFGPISLNYRQGSFISLCLLISTGPNADLHWLRASDRVRTAAHLSVGEGSWRQINMLRHCWKLRANPGLNSAIASSNNSLSMVEPIICLKRGRLISDLEAASDQTPWAPAAHPGSVRSRQNWSEVWLPPFCDVGVLAKSTRFPNRRCQSMKDGWRRAWFSVLRDASSVSR